jgi:hypothetical protein
MLEDSSAGEILPAKWRTRGRDWMKVVKEKPSSLQPWLSCVTHTLARQQEQEEGRSNQLPRNSRVSTQPVWMLMAKSTFESSRSWRRPSVEPTSTRREEDYLMEKVIDGEVNGRLARCPLYWIPNWKRMAPLWSTVPSTRQPAKILWLLGNHRRLLVQTVVRTRTRL